MRNVGAGLAPAPFRTPLEGIADGGIAIKGANGGDSERIKRREATQHVQYLFPGDRVYSLFYLLNGAHPTLIPPRAGNGPIRAPEPSPRITFSLFNWTLARSNSSTVMPSCCSFLSSSTITFRHSRPCSGVVPA